MGYHSYYERWAYKLNMADRLHLRYIRQRLVAEHGMVCALCGKPIESWLDLTVDHIKPRALGGATVYSNCQLAHKQCNLEKGVKQGLTKRKNLDNMDVHPTEI